jgi:hypothetical protein
MKLPHRRQFLQLAWGAAALPAVSRIARAQTYPTKPVRLIVGFPSGRTADISHRNRRGRRGVPRRGGGAGRREARNIRVQKVCAHENATIGG